MLSKFLFASCATSARCAQPLAIAITRRFFGVSDSISAKNLVSLPSVPANRRCFSTATFSVTEDIKKLNQKVEDLETEKKELEAEKKTLQEQLSKATEFGRQAYLQHMIVAVQQRMVALQQKENHLRAKELAIMNVAANQSATDIPLDSNLQQIAASIRKALAECSDLTKDLLLAPNRHVFIPWPTALGVQADRMTLTDRNLKIMGREFFGELYQCVQDLIEQNTSIRRMNVMGTKGMGKSYRLAALVALLLKEGRRVVYLPHCGDSCSQLVSDVRAALLVAFGDDASSAAFNRISQCGTKEQLLRFCLTQPTNSLLFVFDQFNAVQEDSAKEANTGSPNNSKDIAREFFIEISSKHLSVRGYSANNYTVRMLAGKQRNEFDFFVFGGLTQSEYQQWCQDHEKVFFCAGSSDNSIEIDRRKLELRVASGGNPLMLNRFLSKYQSIISLSDSTVPEAKDVFEACFKRWSDSMISDISKEMDSHFNYLIEAEGPANVEIMKQELLACVMGGRVLHSPTFFDHRHMFATSDTQTTPQSSAIFIASPFLPSNWRNSENIFMFSSGIANMVGAEQLCTKFNAEKYFLRQHFIDYALKCDNPVVRGFQIERIVLAEIGTSGLDNVSVHSVKRFEAGTLNFEHELHRNVLYIPKGWNHPKFDAVLISYSTKRVPVQQDAGQEGAIQSADWVGVPQSSMLSVPVAKRQGRKTAMQPGANQMSAESPTFESVTSLSTKTIQTKRVLDHVKIQFIQITIAKHVTSHKLENTRSLVSCLRASKNAKSKSVESPECVSWRKVARVGADVPVRFSVRWLVSKDQIEQIKNSRGFDKSFEKVSSLGTVRSDLDVI